MTEHTQPPRPPDGMRFNAPPGWPPPPSGWVPSADFQPDPSWPAAPPDWQWWVPAGPPILAGSPIPGGSDATAVIAPPPGSAPHPGPPFEPDPPPGAGPDFTAGPYSPEGPPVPSGRPGWWAGRHRLLTAALVVVALLVLGGLGTAGAVIIRNRGDDKPSNSAAKSPEPGAGSASPKPSPQPSASGSASPKSAEHKAACDKAAAPNSQAVTLVKDYTTKSTTNAEIIAAIPPIQANLNAAADTATGALQRDLREYASAVGAFRTSLVQGRDANTAAAKVLIYSIVLKAECGF